jgi:hypothetical protein
MKRVGMLVSTPLNQRVDLRLKQLLLLVQKIMLAERSRSENPTRMVDHASHVYSGML